MKPIDPTNGNPANEADIVASLPPEKQEEAAKALDVEIVEVPVEETEKDVDNAEKDQQDETTQSDE